MWNATELGLFFYGSKFVASVSEARDLEPLIQGGLAIGKRLEETRRQSLVESDCRQNFIPEFHKRLLSSPSVGGGEEAFFFHFRKNPIRIDSRKGTVFEQVRKLQAHGFAGAEQGKRILTGLETGFRAFAGLGIGSCIFRNRAPAHCGGPGMFGFYIIHKMFQAGASSSSGVSFRRAISLQMGWPWAENFISYSVCTFPAFMVGSWWRS